MDLTVHYIKTFVCLVSAPKRHTAHKTMKAFYCFKHGQALYRVYRPPPDQRRAFGGLLNVNLMTVDFTDFRETDCHFLFIHHLSGFRLIIGCWLIYQFSAWQCYIAKYP
jgi:hypothetical protein